MLDYKVNQASYCQEVKMEKSITIIGGGLTGLSAGCYGQMNGYKTTIFEMHDKAGGVCTAWKRKSYIIDGAMNWLVGTRPGANYAMPVDKPAELFDASDREKMGQMLPGMELMQKWSISTRDFAQRLKNPYLREVFSNFHGLPMVMFIMVLGLQHSKSAGYVIGGALALVKPIEKRYQNLGGKIRFNSKVAKILVEDDKAVGVKLASGEEQLADYIVSAGDGRTAIFDMLGGKYINEKIKNMYDHPNLFAPLVHVGLGVKRAFDEIPSSVGGLRFPLNKPINIAGKEEKNMNVFIYNFDPTLAPKGKNVVVVYFETDYDYWHTLRQDLARYKAEKDRIANDIIAGLEQRFSVSLTGGNASSYSHNLGALYRQLAGRL
jgi:phytoene dehydrogenase-like protein